jgi:hypothetical protein
MKPNALMLPPGTTHSAVERPVVEVVAAGGRVVPGGKVVEGIAVVAVVTSVGSGPVVVTSTVVREPSVVSVVMSPTAVVPVPGRSAQATVKTASGRTTAEITKPRYPSLNTLFMILPPIWVALQ